MAKHKRLNLFPPAIAASTIVTLRSRWTLPAHTRREVLSRLCSPRKGFTWFIIPLLLAFLFSTSSATGQALNQTLHGEWRSADNIRLGQLTCYDYSAPDPCLSNPIPGYGQLQVYWDITHKQDESGYDYWSVANVEVDLIVHDSDHSIRDTFEFFAPIEQIFPYIAEIDLNGSDSGGRSYTVPLVPPRGRCIASEHGTDVIEFQRCAQGEVGTFALHGPVPIFFAGATAFGPWGSSGAFTINSGGWHAMTSGGGSSVGDNNCATAVGSNWNGPSWLGMGPLGSAPSVAVRPTDEQDVFWSGTNGNLWGGRWAHAPWEGPIQAGFGPLGSPPSAAAWGTNLDVVWKGTDEGLWGAQFDGAQWNGPLSVPGMNPLGSKPTIGAHDTGELDVFWKGTDSNLWEAFWMPGAGFWQGPYTRGMGPLGSEPTVAVRASGEEDVFWEGTNGNLWGARWTGQYGWDGPIQFGFGPLGSAPSVAACGPRVYVFWKGTDGELWGGELVDSLDSSFANMLRIGPYPVAPRMGPLGSGPTVGAHANGELDVFWEGQDGNLWEAFRIP